MKKTTKKTVSLHRLYTRDHRAYFKQIDAGKIKPDDEDRKYAGYRAWLDGYNAGLQAKRPAPKQTTS